MEKEFVPVGFKALKYMPAGQSNEWTGAPIVESGCYPFRWKMPATEMSPCVKCGSIVPAKGCGCGIYAGYYVGVVLTEYMTTVSHFLVVVEGRGSYRMGQFGWRAQQARVVNIIEVSPTDFVHMCTNEAAAGFFKVDIMTLEQAVILVANWRQYWADRIAVED